MRRKPTDAEARGWEILRDRRCLGLKFRRQHVIAGYILDFYCAELRVAVELDGPVHEKAPQKARDEERTWALGRAGIKVIRIRNDELSAGYLANVLSPLVSRSTRARPPSPYHGEGDRG